MSIYFTLFFAFLNETSQCFIISFIFILFPMKLKENKRKTVINLLVGKTLLVPIYNVIII